MYEFISNDLDSQKVFQVIDQFYDGWFTSRSITWNKFLKTFPAAPTWTKKEIFPAMLWLYYNYPVDYLADKNSHVPGIRNYRRANIVRIACYLKAGGIKNRLAILKTITDSSYKSFKNEEDRLEFLKAIVDENIPATFENTILDNNPFRPLLKDIIKRSSPKIIFTKKAINLDKELMPKLLVTFVSWENGWRALKEGKKAKAAKAQPNQFAATKGPKGHLLDQIIVDMENAWKQPVIVPALVEVVGQGTRSPLVERTAVTTKPFVPYKESLGFDIDPNMIANKIRQISATSSKPVRLSGSPPDNWEDRLSSSVSAVGSKRSVGSGVGSKSKAGSGSQGTEARWSDASGGPDVDSEPQYNSDDFIEV